MTTARERSTRPHSLPALAGGVLTRLRRAGGLVVGLARLIACGLCICPRCARMATCPSFQTQLPKWATLWYRMARTDFYLQ